MKTSVLIRNARMASGSCPADILVSGGVISGKALPELFPQTLQPGREDKERIATATAAALHGGVTGLMAMPDTAPVMDNAAQITTFMEICRTDALVDVIPSGCLTKGDGGEEQASYDSLRAKGVRFITDGDRAPDNMLLLYRAMQYASNLNLTFALRGDVPALTARAAMHPGTTSYRLGLAGSPSCAEEIGLETIIRLSVDTGNSLHVQTVATSALNPVVSGLQRRRMSALPAVETAPKRSADILRRCKPETTGLSAEVALHHLLFTHEDVGCYDTNYKTLPPLRDRKDVDALIEAVNDGTIDCIVSDHTPCTPFSKLQDFVVAPQGMISLDTFLPAIYQYLVQTGRMSWETVVRACSDAPRRLMGLSPVSLEEGAPANLVVFDPEGETPVTDETLRSRARNTPFLGKTLQGKVDAVIRRATYSFKGETENFYHLSTINF